MNRNIARETNESPISFRNWNILHNTVENKEVLDSVLKFHYRTLNHTNDEIVNFENQSAISTWAGMVANQDILPNIYEEIIDLKINHHQQINSFTKFQTDIPININDLGQILFDAFGREAPYSSKRYASAGALYPVIPLLVILKDNKSDNKLKPGCYVFDSTNSRLLKIAHWTMDDIDKVKKLINYDSDFHPPHFLAYALDIRRAITKYTEKGYRHGLIEVGFMTQCFRESLQKYDKLGDRCWSYFLDIPFTHICGLNFRLCPIVLVQWFGFYSQE